ncbi:MAG: beta strand repeat-containing protein, partial [Polynucleobacter sp.]
MILSDAADLRLAGAQVCAALQTSAQASFYGYGSTTISRALTGAISAYKHGPGVVTFSGSNSHTLGTYVVAGTLTITDISALPSFNINGKVDVASAATLAVYNAVTDAQVVAMLGTTNFKAGSFIGFDTTSGSRTYPNAITNTTQGMLGVAKLGSNTLTISSNVNTYTGATKVLAGTLATSAGNRIPDASAVEISSGATVTLGGSDTIASLAGAGTMTCGGNTLTIGGSNTTDFSGSLTNTQTTGNSLFKTGTGSQTFSGTASIGAGIQFQTGTVSLTGTFTQTLAGTQPRNTQLAIAAANVFTLNSSGSTTFTGLMFGENSGGTSTVNVTAGTFAVNGQVWMSGVLSTLNLSGGSVTSQSWDIGGGGGTTTSIVNQSAGLFACSGTLRWGIGSASATSVYNLDGGTFRVAAFFRGNGTNTFNFNGGTFTTLANLTVTQPLITFNVKAGGAFFSVPVNVTMVFDSALVDSGGGGIQKDGAGLFVLSQANTYTGATTINTGVLQLGNSGTTGSIANSSGITNNSGLAFSRSNTLTQGTDFPAISGAGTVTQAGSGTTILSLANTYTGNTLINAGNLRLGNDSGFGVGGQIRFNGGTMQFSSGSTTDISDRILNNSQAVRIDTRGFSPSFASLNNTNTGGLIKSGTGTLTFTGSGNTFTGNITASGGTTRFLGPYTATGTVSVNGTTPTLALTSTFTQTYTALGVRSFQVALSNGTSATVNVGGSANVTLNGGMMLGDNNGGNGTMNVTGGTVSCPNGTWLAGAVCLLNVSGGTFTSNRVENGGGTGAGTVTVSGTGTINCGSLILCRGSSAGTSATVNLNGGTLTLTGITHVTTAQSATLNFNGGTLSSLNTMAFPATISAVVKAGGAILNTSGALSLPMTLATDGTGGGLTKQGAGSLTLSGATNYTGATTISAGTLRKSFSSGNLSYAEFTNTTLTAAFNATPNNGATYQIFSGATTQTYATVTVTGAPGVVCSYNS